MFRVVRVYCDILLTKTVTWSAAGGNNGSLVNKKIKASWKHFRDSVAQCLLVAQLEDIDSPKNISVERMSLAKSLFYLTLFSSEPGLYGEN